MQMGVASACCILFSVFTLIQTVGVSCSYARIKLARHKTQVLYRLLDM